MIVLGRHSDCRLAPLLYRCTAVSIYGRLLFTSRAPSLSSAMSRDPVDIRSMDESPSDMEVMVEDKLSDTAAADSLLLDEKATLCENEATHDPFIEERLTSSASAFLLVSQQHSRLIERHFHSLAPHIRTRLSVNLLESVQLWAQTCQQLCSQDTADALHHPSSAAWGALPSALLPGVCHYLPSMKDLLRLSAVNRRFYALLGDGSADEGATRRLCWSLCPTVHGSYSRADCLFHQQSPFDAYSTVLEVWDRRPLTSEQRREPLDHRRILRLLRPLRDVRVAALSVSLVQSEWLSRAERERDKVEEAELQPLMELSLGCLPLLRHVQLSSPTDEGRQKAPELEVGLLLRHLPVLLSLDVALYDRQSLMPFFPTSFASPIVCGLLSLKVSPLLFYHILASAFPLFRVVRVALDLDAPFPHHIGEIPENLPSSRSVLLVFPALRYLDLPADFPLPLDSFDNDSALEGWAQLLHIRWNVVYAWTRALPPLLSRLTSLHLVVDLHSPDLRWQHVDLLRSKPMVNDVVDQTLLGLPQLSQLTLTIRPAQERLVGDERIDTTGLQPTEAAQNFDFDEWFAPLTQLRFLFVDDSSSNTAGVWEDFLIPRLWDDGAWRSRVEHLGLSLHYSSLIRIARCWRAEDWPALKECYMGLTPWMEGKEMHRSEEWATAEEDVADSLMRRVIGEKWVSRAQLMSRRVDAVWMEAQGLHAVVHSGPAWR